MPFEGIVEKGASEVAGEERKRGEKALRRNPLRDSRKQTGLQ